MSHRLIIQVPGNIVMSTGKKLKTERYQQMYLFADTFGNVVLPGISRNMYGSLTNNPLRR
jgi:hypothetical protein